MNIATIDIEGDGLRKEIQQKIFENVGHFDKNTLPWCIGITTDKGTKMYVCKLPSQGRLVGKIGEKEYYGPWHSQDAVVPETIDGVEVKRFDNRDNMILYVVSELLRLSAEGYEILFKGYRDHRIIEPEDLEESCEYGEIDENFDYDRQLILAKLVDIANRALRQMKLVYTKNWNYTHRQGYTGQESPNDFIENGIRHCKEDVEQLYRLAIEGKTWRPE